ncbi:hypothetical protein BU23DRAFT_494060 [Bimuria novae-zelandiae CBS 107.79]|uniref:Fungal-specific transcription factor domain-containing protein n=1 Tax=Bimuria novae-zelandiae CBS 107.79 TaxID=1447943 RepID=A0A6A5UGP1_9PLEO|nr:hypothetical protein BU23DRAFT_494060 [Bimuria novae-zelandiae CBS 107.79]
MEQTFCFVNGAQIDRSTKRQMRRHMMMGKNAGKTVQRRSKKELAWKSFEGKDNQSKKEILQRGNRDLDAVTLPVNRIGRWAQAHLHYYEPTSIYDNVLSGLAFPVELTPHFAEVISTYFLFISDKLYPVSLGISMESSKYTWIRVLMADEAAFHCNIAQMQACNELFLGDGEDSPMAMYHLSKTLEHVQARLQSAEALSDSTMSLVMALITQEQVRHQHEAASIHMDGLVGMIQLRGGLASLEGCLPVLLKACKTDLMYTLQREVAPRFHRDNMTAIKCTLASLHLPFDNETSHMLAQHSELDPRLQDVLGDVISTSTLFNDLPSTRKVDLYLYQEIFVSILYRLHAIPFHPNPNLPPTIGDAYHVGLTLFMMSLFLQHGRHRILQYSNVTRRLKDVLESMTLEQEDWLRFWLLMVEAVWVAEDEGTEWLVRMVGEQARKMGLETWKDARDAVLRYPWIGALHDEPGRLIWEKARFS